MEEYKSAPNSIGNKSISGYQNTILDGTRKQMKLYEYISRGTASDIMKLREYFLMSPSM